MKYKLLALGTLKASSEKQLLDHYLGRLTLDFGVQELISKKHHTKEEEGALILSHLSSNDYVIGLDEKGVDLSTRSFFELLENKSNQTKVCTFIIGGADGLSEAVKKRCQMLICFGKMTWPHMLVRALLVEQLYRCQQIKNNHPYHRD
ncbi:MAG: 23S rRNA (pseudouridine(1915)-N(3))-methyltransferase RlmH [Alphaproteobacteria bacterium]|nr:23S rRNA (pseudouridine(1915)-N(3))-methyltransferase RlmH [Alphaproteobacteria bacterium]